jgi:hypothetical protein
LPAGSRSLPGPPELRRHDTASIWHRRALDQAPSAMHNIIGRVILVFTIARDAEILDLAAGMQPDAPAAPRNLAATPALRRRLSFGCVEMDHLFC